MKTLKDYADPDAKAGGYTFDGCWWEDAGALITGMLGFCGCGQPETNLAWILESMELLMERGPKKTGWAEYRVWWDAQDKKQMAHFKSEGARLFFMYWLDKEGYTEHGGSVFGAWPTEKGEQLRALLREWKAQQAVSPDKDTQPIVGPK